MRRRREATATFSLSFLDDVCFRFEAIVLLLVLTKIVEPRALENSRIDLETLIVDL